MKKRREDREVEKAQMEEEKEMIERERALADAVELEKQILDGADVRELGLKAERQRQRERLARARQP